MEGTCGRKSHSMNWNIPLSPSLANKGEGIWEEQRNGRRQKTL